MKTIATVFVILLLVTTGLVRKTGGSEYERTANICLKNNPEYTDLHNILDSSFRFKLHSKNDPIFKKALSFGLDDYDEIGLAAVNLKVDPARNTGKFKKRLHVIDFDAVINGSPTQYILSQRVDGLLIFNVTNPSYPRDMPRPILIGIKEAPGHNPQSGDPLCLYGVQFRLLEVVKTKTTDGFDSILPIFEPIKVNIVEATMDKIAEKKKADAARLEAKRMRQSKELKQRHEEEQRIAVIEKDIADYQKITSSANDKEIMSTAWQSLVNKYPEAKNIEMGNVTALMMVLRLPNNETVIDNITGLIWQKEDNGQRYSWVDAITYCKNLRLRVLSDWRLPTITELESIVVHSENSRTTPQIDITLFPNTKSAYAHYWSATTIGDGEYAEAYALDFDQGRKVALHQAKTFYTVLSTEYVRCVR